MPSTPGNSGGRPDTVVPKTTSRAPAWWPEQQRPRPLHHRVEREPVLASEGIERLGGSGDRWSCRVSRPAPVPSTLAVPRPRSVGSEKPASACRQKRSDSSRPRAWSHPM
jgi:hypothetical protein